MLMITYEHKHTNMHSNKDFQLSSLVLFSSKKVTKPDFISPMQCQTVFFLPGLFHRYNIICESFKYLTHVCHELAPT